MKRALLLGAACLSSTLALACGGKVRDDSVDFGSAGGSSGSSGSGGPSVSSSSGGSSGGVTADGAIASALDTPGNLVVSNGVLYFSDGQKVLSCPTSGCGDRPTRLALLDSYVTSLATNGVEVFFTDSEDVGSVYAYAIGAAPGSFRKVATGLLQPRGLSWDTDRNVLHWVTFDGNVQRCGSICDAGPTTLVSGEVGHPYAVIASGSDLLWTTEGVTTRDGEVRRCSLSAARCVPETLVGRQNYARTIVANGTSIYWVSDGESTVRTCSRPACNDVRKLPLAGQTGLALDGDHVYWSFFTNGWVQSCPLTGCEMPLAIAEGLRGPGSIALDDNHVYVATAGWSGSGDYQTRVGTIVMRTK